MTTWVERWRWTGAPKGGGTITAPVHRFFVHHTVGPAVTGDAALALAEVYRRQHTNTNGWSDIGYSWLVTQAGELIEGRGWGRAGAHTSGYNSSSYAVAWMGDSTSVAATGAALEAIADLYLAGLRLGAVAPGATIDGHRDVNATACPGDLLYAELATIRRLTAAPQQEAPDMTPEESARLARIETMMDRSAMAWTVKIDNTDVSQLYANVYELTVSLREVLPALRALPAQQATLNYLTDQVARLAARPVEVHIVQPGDTARSIAERYSVPVDRVLGQTDGGALRVGQRIDVT